jgi:hypothetical protein
MKIYRNAVEIADVKATDSSYQDASIMGDNSITLDFYSITQVNIHKGDYCTAFGEQYAVKERPIPAIERGVYHYNFKLVGSVYELEKVKMFLHDGARDLTRSEFDYTCTPNELIQMIVRNLNSVQSFGWVVGSVVAGDVKILSFSKQNCLEVLQNAAQEWDTEFWINGYTVNLCSRQSGSAPNRVLEIGEGLKAIDQEKNTSQKTITRLYATGSSKNLPGGYGSPKLKMDVPYLEIAGAPYVIEDVKDFPEVYPRRVGSVSQVRFTEKGIYYFKDATLEFDPNDLEVAGLKKHVIFQSGPLIGLDFEVKYDTTEEEFELIAYDESDGFRFPAGQMVPVIDNTYIIYNISMPPSYVTVAMAELKAKAQAYLNTNAADLISLNLTTDEVYFTRNDVSVALGETVTVKNENIDTLIAGRNIRVTAFKRYLNHKNKYENLKVSDVVYINPISEIQNKTKEIERVIDRAGMTEPNYFARNWRDVAEIANMINTLAAEMLIIGKIEGQFSLIGTFFTSNAGGNQNRFMASSGILEHTTIPDDINPGLWSIAPCDLILDSSTTPYYLYARCSTETDAGTMIVSVDPIVYDVDELWYYFLVGVISSVRVNSRTFQTVYGFTQISGNQIVTGKMQSADGFNYLDFDNNRFKIGNASTGLDWNATTANKLTIRGGIVQSPSGITFPMTVFRGEYTYDTTYYQGDEVTWEGQSWIYTANQPSVGIPGYNSPYWSLKTAKGGTGIEGKSVEFIFKRTTTSEAPARPPWSQNEGYVPIGWTNDQQGVTSLYQYEFVAKREKINGAWSIFSAPALWAKYSFDGGDGIDGKSIEFIFERSTTAAAPARPSSNNVDDYVPSGWTDDQQGVTDVYQYEFVAKREKVNGAWGIFSAPALWAKYSFDGGDGIDGKSIEFIFKRSTNAIVPTTPSSNNIDDYVPPGWTDDQQGVTSTYQYEFASKREKVNGTWGAFSIPAAWAKWSFDGGDGIDGKSIEFIFKSSSSIIPPETPSSVNTDDFVPSGWTDDQSGVNSTYPYEFVSKREKVNGAWGIFSSPALWAKYGFDGAPGTTGPSGVYRGLYDPTKIYYGNDTRVDAVKYGSIYYIALSNAPASSFSNIVPTNTSYWKVFGAQFESVATDLLLSRQIIASEINTDTITALGAITAGTFSLGSGAFVVDVNGKLTASGATIKSAGSGQRVVIDSLTNDMNFYNSDGVSAIRLGSNVHGEGYNGIEMSGCYIINDGAGYVMFRNGTLQSGISPGGFATTGFISGKYLFLNSVDVPLVPNGSIFKDSFGSLCYKKMNGTVITIVP